MINKTRILAALAITVTNSSLSACVSAAEAENPRAVNRDLFYPSNLDYCWFDNGLQEPGWYLCDAPWYLGDRWSDRFGWRHWHTRPHHHPHGPRPTPGQPPVGGQPANSD